MRILIFGTSGLIGSAVTARLTGLGDEVIGVSRGVRAIAGPTRADQLDIAKATERLARRQAPSPTQRYAGLRGRALRLHSRHSGSPAVREQTRNCVELIVSNPEGPLIAHHGVECNEELPGDGDQGELGGFPCCKGAI